MSVTAGAGGQWSHSGFAVLASRLAARAGLAFSPQRRDQLEAGVRRVMARAGVGDVATFVAALDAGAADLDDLVDELTVGESYFFRQPEHFELLRREVLPPLVARRAASPGPVVRAWSAGCAAGEEPYTLAILLAEAGLAGRGAVLGTDVSRAALARARAATYSAWALRGTSESFRRRWFDREGARYRLRADARRGVAFARLNLAADPWPDAVAPRGVDVILCRNVLIYFTPESVARVARGLYDALADGGWLLTAPSDPLLAADAPWDVVPTAAGVCYRRAAPGAAPFVASSPGGPARPPERPPEAWCDGALAATPGRVSVPSPDPLPARPPDPLDAVREAYARGDYAGAEVLARDLPDRPEAALLRVRALANAEGAAAAARACAAAAARHPLAAELHYVHGVLLLGEGRLDDAAGALRRALLVDHDLAVAYFALGTVLRQRGDRAGAARAFRNARARCAALPPDASLPLGEGERAGPLAAAAAAALAALDTDRRATP